MRVSKEVGTIVHPFNMNIVSKFHGYILNHITSTDSPVQYFFQSQFDIWHFRREVTDWLVAASYLLILSVAPREEVVDFALVSSSDQLCRQRLRFLHTKWLADLSDWGRAYFLCASVTGSTKKKDFFTLISAKMNLKCCERLALLATHSTCPFRKHDVVGCIMGFTIAAEERISSRGLRPLL